MKGYSHFGKAFKISKGRRRVGVFHHLNPKLRVHRMNGDVYRGKVHFYDSVNVLFFEVREGHVVPEKEAEAGIVVFKIEGLAHVGRHLVDKTEDALIFAAMLLVHKVGFKVKTQLVILRLFDGHHTVLAVKTDYFDFKTFVNHIEPVVQNVLYVISVY